MVEEKETKETPETDEKTPTPEEQLTAAQDELTRVTKELGETQKGLKTAHSRLTEKDTEIKGLSNLHSLVEDLGEKVKILAAAQSAGIQVSEEDLENMPQKQKTNLLNEFDKLDEKRKQRETESAKQAQETEYKQKADDIYERAQKVFADDEDKLFKAQFYLTYGNSDLAEKMVEKAEGDKSMDTKKESKETEEEKVNRLAEEKYQKRLEDEGLLKTDTATPSGMSKSDQEVLAAYIENPTDHTLRDQATKILNK